jgi:hypothetical protein
MPPIQPPTLASKKAFFNSDKFHYIDFPTFIFESIQVALIGL